MGDTPERLLYRARESRWGFPHRPRLSTNGSWVVNCLACTMGPRYLVHTIPDVSVRLFSGETNVEISSVLSKAENPTRFGQATPADGLNRKRLTPQSMKDSASHPPVDLTCSSSLVSAAFEHVGLHTHISQFLRINQDRPALWLRGLSYHLRHQ